MSGIRNNTNSLGPWQCILLVIHMIVKKKKKTKNFFLNKNLKFSWFRRQEIFHAFVTSREQVHAFAGFQFSWGYVILQEKLVWLRKKNLNNAERIKILPSCWPLSSIATAPSHPAQQFFSRCNALHRVTGHLWLNNFSLLQWKWWQWKYEEHQPS